MIFQVGSVFGLLSAAFAAEGFGSPRYPRQYPGPSGSAPAKPCSGISGSAPAPPPLGVSGASAAFGVPHSYASSTRAPEPAASQYSSRTDGLGGTAAENTLQSAGSNLTRTDSSLVVPPSGIASGSRHLSSAPYASSTTCSGATLNVLGASLDWWYKETLTYVASVIETQYAGNGLATGWSIVPASTTFDVTSALATPSCTWDVVTTAVPTSVSGSFVNSTRTYWEGTCYSTPTPVAAATTVLSQDAFTTPNATSGTGTLPNLAVTPAPASISLPSSGGTFSQGTPFVYFSAYEVMSKSLATHANGSQNCAETTERHSLPTPFSFVYDGANVDGSKAVGEGVTGDVNPAFLDVVEMTSLTAGSWVAAPTVAIVVQRLMAAQVPLASTAAPQPSESSLQAVTPTLPPGITPSAPGTYTVVPGTESPHVESSAFSLELPPISTPAPTMAVTTKQLIGGSSEAKSSTPESTDISIVPTTADGQEATATATQDEMTSEAAGHSVASGAASGGVGGSDGLSSGGAGRSTDGSNTGSTVLAFVGHQGTTEVSLDVAVNPTQTIATLEYPGGIVTATAQPTNALQVLSEALVDGGGTISSAPPAVSSGSATITVPPVLTIDGQVFTANIGSSYIISGQRLTPGGAITFSGANGLETVSLNVDGNKLVSVVNGVTATSTIGPVTAGFSDAPVLTIDGRQYTAVLDDTGAGPAYVVDGLTLTRGGSITIAGPSGPETISLDYAGTAIVDVSGDRTVTSGISGALGVAPSDAPVLTIDGQTFTAIGNGPTYIIDGQTLTPGEVETVTIAGRIFVITLSPQATMLAIEEEGPNGQITATTFETLSPAQGARSTITNTIAIVTNATAGAAATSGGAYTTASTTGPAIQMQNTGAARVVQLSGVVVGIGSLALAVFL